MKKRILAFLLMVLLVLGVLPMGALAAGEYGQVRVIVENTTFTKAEDSDDGTEEPAWSGTLVDEWVDLSGTSTMMSCVVAALDANGYEQTGAESNYISDINGLGEFNGSMLSGWMGTLNDWFTSEGFAGFTVANGKLSDGDEIRILFTMAFGEDLGGSWSNSDTRVKDAVITAYDADGNALGDIAWSKSFDADTKEYTLTLPEGTAYLNVVPTAMNKNYQVRTYLGTPDTAAAGYKRSARIPVADGSVVHVVSAAPAWPSMNTSDGAVDYAFTCAFAAQEPVTVPVTGISLDEETLTLTVGETETLTATVSPEDASDKAVSWESTDAAIAAVDENGVVTAIAAGSTFVTATTADGGFTVQCAVTVKEPVPADYHTVTVKVAPKTADAAFFSDANAENPWKYVTDNGVVGSYHEYTVMAPAGDITFRGKDGDTDLGGMCFTVSDEDTQSVTLVRTNFYTTNSAVAAIGDYEISVLPGSMAPVVNGAQYIDGSARVVTPTLLWANGNAMLYNWTIQLNGELAKTKGVAVSINNTLAATLTAAQNKTFTLADQIGYKITAPQSAEVRMFNQIKNFNVEEYTADSVLDNGDGTATYVFDVAESANLSYRVSMEGKITRAGYMGSTEKTAPVVVTFDENENPAATETTAPYAESSTLLNINCGNDLQLSAGETYRVRAYRGAWQIINSQTANIMIEPDFHFNVISGGEHIALTPAENRCSGNAKNNWMDITGISAGTAIVEVSYDAIIIGGSGTTLGGQYGATDPARKSLIVINVGGSEGTLTMKAAGADNIWDTELDTVYTFDDTAVLHFTADLDGVQPDAALSTDRGASWTAVAKDADGFTATGLVPGNNILKFTAGGKTNYQVVRTAKITYTLTNESRDNDAVYAGDTVSIHFNGIYQPAPKFSGIYNPGFGGKPPHAITYNVPDGVTVKAEGGQYDFVETNKYIVTLGDAGTYTFTGGNVHFNIMGVADPLGGHRVLTDAGVGANFGAVSTSHVRCVFPDLTITAAAPAGECEHIWDDGVVTLAHTAAKAGKIRYTCTLCGLYKDEATKKGACSKFAVEVAKLPATCTEDGHTAGTMCSECRKVLSGMEVIPASGHTFSTDWTDDETDHWHAAVCGHKNEIADKAAHSGGTATCTERAVCEICNTEYGALGAHVLTFVPAVPATAAANGCKAHYVCECGKLFADAEAKTEITDPSTLVIPALKDGWVTENGARYYYKNGVMQTGWVKDGGKWYFLNKNGVMQTGWVKDGGKWYYLNKNGVMQTGWLKDNGKWYYLNANGAMATGWVKVSGKWYYMNGSGAMQTGWVKVSGKWYYMNGSGAMATGWVKISGKWYYLTSSGAMKTGWLKDDGKWYYLKTSGAMAVSETLKIDGVAYTFNAKGVWIK